MSNPTTPLVSGVQTNPFNSREVHPYNSSYESATVDVFTGISDIEKLAEVRNRAIYDPNALSYNPIADSGTGVLFPDAVQAKTIVESGLRVRPTSFKGPKQLDISYDNQDLHFERQIHPNAWSENLEKFWYKKEKNAVFKGFPNPDYFTLYTDAIPTHNIQNLTHAQLNDAQIAGEYNHDNYLNTVGSLLKSGAVPRGPAAANIQHVVQTDGGGVNGDPSLLQRINEEYEADFERAARLRVDQAFSDPRFDENNVFVQYQIEQQKYAEDQETQFQVQGTLGIPTMYATTRV